MSCDDTQFKRALREASEMLLRIADTYRVRLPRPDAEPSAKAKCPTCRCMIAPGSTCECCATTGDDPPLPDLDRDDAEPSASGEGIAKSVGYGIEVCDGTDRWFLRCDVPDEVVRWINASVANATRELRKRAARAERDAAKWERVATEGDAREFGRIAETEAAFAERDTAIARAELAERVVDAARYCCTKASGSTASYVLRDVLDAYDAAQKDGGK